jgi:hypothetical protein
MLENWLVDWASLIASIIKIISFRYFDPGFDVDLSARLMVKRSLKRRAEREASKRDKEWKECLK